MNNNLKIETFIIDDKNINEHILFGGIYTFLLVRDKNLWNKIGN